MSASVSVRLGVDGKADVTAAHKEVGDSGQQAFDSIAASADKATAATDATSAAADRQAAKWTRLAEAARASQAAAQSQSAFNALAGVGVGSGKSVQDSAAVFEAAAKAEEDLAAKTAALKAELDPTWAAQQKLNAAVATANELFAAGKITAVEQTAAIALAQRAFGDAEKAARGLAGGVAFSSVQVQELGAVVHHSIDALAAGASPLRVLSTEGARLGVALGSGPTGAAGALALLTSPIALVIGGILALGAATVGLVALEQGHEAQEHKLALALQGRGAATGATVGYVQQLAVAQAQASDITTSAARNIIVAMATIGQVSVQQLPAATAVVKGYAAVMGEELLPAAAELAKAFADPAKGAVDLNDKLHFLSAAQVENIKALEEQGDKTAALDLLLKALKGTVGEATDQMNFLARGAHDVHIWYDEATDSVGNFLRKLAGLKSGDAQTELAEATAQLTALQALNDHQPAVLAAIATQQGRIAEATAKIKAASDRTDSAAASAASDKLKAAADDLDPQAAQIQAKMGAIKQLRDALADSSGKALAAAGLTRASAEADIVEGDKEIAKLKERADMRDKHTESLQREAAAMVANAQSALAVAAAYLQSDAAGEKAEANRKAITDATKKGIDVEAQARRQLAVTIGDVAVQGAKAVADLEGRDAAQRSVNDQVAAGLLTSTQAGQQLQIELQLRPLVSASLVAEGAQRAILTQEIARQRAALQSLNADQATARLQAGSVAADDRIAQLRVEATMADDLTGARERLLAVLKLEQSPDYQASGDERAKEVATINAIADADQQLQTRRAQYAASALRDDQNGLAMQQLELAMVGSTTDARDAAVAQLQRIQALKAQGIDLDSAAGQAILQQGAALDAMAAKVRAVNDNWSELKSAGDRFVDDVLNPQNWTSWEQFGKTAILDLTNELLKLGAINPLKNLLFGESNPTLGGVGGVLGKLFGGGSSSDSSGSMFSASSMIDTVFQGGDFLPGFANGTDSSPAGWARIDEDGGEIVNLPDGSQVIPADQTRKLVSRAANGNGAVTLNMPITLNAQGAGPREIDELKAQVADLKRNLPGQIVSTMNQAHSRSQAA